MIKNNILLLLVLLTMGGCATYKAQYKEDPEEIDVFPDRPEIKKSFYLIGDVGKSPMGGLSDGLLSLQDYLRDQQTEDDYLIFLGDNIYPTGMPEEGTDFRPVAENHLDAQIAVARQFNGQVYFIPGNHDYYNENLVNVKREKDYIEQALQDHSIWQPRVGCPIESKQISDDIQLIIIDSQWYLAQWDNIPTINDDCDQIKTRDQFYLEIESEFKKNQDKTILVSLHHPIFTNGVHGGQYAAIKHLFPTQRKIPVPVFSSLINLIRTSGGVSAQDKQNKRYQELADRLTTLAITSTAPRIIFASGHEHTLQYIENSGVRQIVSGSGSKKSYAALSNDGLFSYGGNGFARLDIMHDGSSWVRFYGLKEGRHQLLYTKKAIEEPRGYDLEQLPVDYPAFAKANIYTDKRTNKSEVFKGLWGEKYRKLYGTEINAKVALLDTLKGGLEVVRAGGGHQTRSLRLKDKSGREYNLRALKKSAVQFLQTTVFKDQDITGGFEETAAEDLLYDFYTAAHPYGALTIPVLANALNIYHTNPEIYYVPKQPALGTYNNNYGDELYMLVERPEKNFNELESFGKPEDIISTDELFERLRRDEKFKVDQEAYIRARMFDMLIGDWDRHQDQWRWAAFKQDDNRVLYRPIPRDRDQVYSNFDGAVFATLRTLTGITKQFATYDGTLDNTKWFNTAATYLDRSLAQESGRSAWIEQARFIQENLSNDKIREAFNALPPSIYADASTESIIESMMARRDHLVDIATRYYQHLSKLAIVTATDKDDIIEINRRDKGKTQITIYRNKKGSKADLIFNRIFDRSDTREIWLYALDDDDIIRSSGKANNPIRVRVIGGQNNDIYDLETGRAITVYDHKSKKNTIVDLDGAPRRLSDNYDINLYNPKKNIKAVNVLTPAIGFNPDDGVRIGLQNTYTVDGFNRNPHTQIHKITAGYFFATQGYALGYSGEFAGIFDKSNLLVNLGITGPTFAENFFGFGNESTNNDGALGFDFNRVRLSTYSGGLGMSYRGEYGSNFTISGTVRGIEVEEDSDRFISVFANNQGDPNFYDRKWFGDVNIKYNYSAYDNELNPTRGMLFEVDTGAISNLNNFDRTFMYFNPKMGFYNAITTNRKWVLKTLAQAQINIGNDYEFYQSAQLGQNSGLRGYRTQRFSGESAFATSADLRYSFDEFRTGFVPLQIGVFAGGDVGRVWQDGERSERWYNDYGGGIWINSAEAIGATFNLFNGADGLRFSFQIGFNF